jgi:hypothetical protein
MLVFVAFALTGLVSVEFAGAKSNLKSNFGSWWQGGNGGELSRIVATLAMGGGIRARLQVQAGWVEF